MLDVQELCKSFNNKPFLTDLTFKVASGESLFLLGRNGAGKTLLLNILATLVKPTSGTVSISGLDAFSNLKHVRSQIGYITSTYEGYPKLSVVDYLTFFASAYKIKKMGQTAAIDAVLELMDIQNLCEQQIGVLSTDERLRLLYAKTFLHDPQIWLLDEPLAQLEPQAQIEMVELLRELQTMGKTLVIATDRLEDVIKLRKLDTDDRTESDKLGILVNGQFAVFNTFNLIQKEFKDKNNSEELKPNWLAELYLEVTKS